MLKRKRQKKYLIKRCRKVVHHLYVFASSGGQEDLHKLRVEIKKLKAFIKLVKLYRGRKKIITQQYAVRELFQHAGTIREADLNLQIMKQFHISYPSFRAKEMRTLRQEPARFRSHVNDYDKIIKNIASSLTKLLRPLRNKKLKHWVGRQLKKISVILTSSSRDQLHSARKRIKNLVYIYGTCPKRLRAKLSLNAGYLDQLQDVIGKWHDADVAVRVLDAHNAESKGGLDRLRKERGQTGAAIPAVSHHFWDKVSGRNSGHN